MMPGGPGTRRSSPQLGTAEPRARADGAVTCRLSTVQPLTRLEKSVLDFERVLWQHVRAKEEAIWRTFDVSPSRYFQFLAVIIRKDAALDHDPLLVRRLRRRRDGRGSDQLPPLRPESREEREG